MSGLEFVLKCLGAMAIFGLAWLAVCVGAAAIEERKSERKGGKR